MSMFANIRSVRRAGTWFCLLVGFYGTGGLSMLGYGLGALSDPQQPRSAEDPVIVFVNIVWLIGMAVTLLLFLRSCKKHEIEHGNRMHPIAVLASGFFATVALALLATTAG